MATWKDFANSEPEMASHGRRLIYAYGPAGYLASVSAAGWPRLHPVAPFASGDELVVLIDRRSGRARDVASDARVALHTVSMEESDDEFYVQGSVREVTDPSLVEVAAAERAAARVVSGPPVEDCALFSIDLERVLLELYKPRDAGPWEPPAMSKWAGSGTPARRPAGALPRPIPGARWSEIDPSVEERARAMIKRFGIGLGYLATVRADGGPRLHPFCPIVAAGGLYGFIVASPKQRDLLRNGRAAIHSFQDPEYDNELSISATAEPIHDAAIEAEVWRVYTESGGVSENHEMFEFRVRRLVLAEYGAARGEAAWPPARTTWTAPVAARRG